MRPCVFSGTTSHHGEFQPAYARELGHELALREALTPSPSPIRRERVAAGWVRVRFMEREPTRTCPGRVEASWTIGVKIPGLAGCVGEYFPFGLKHEHGQNRRH